MSGQIEDVLTDAASGPQSIGKKKLPVSLSKVQQETQLSKNK
jgi:hypothetical protein